jgi:DNA-binding response OmpR family regulator
VSTTGSAHHRPHVLIVSDDTDLSAFLAEGLVYGGFWTSTVASGIQTLEVFRLRTFDLVLVDAGLHDLSAAEVIRRLRGRSTRSTEHVSRTDIPIMVIAASNQEAAGIEAAAQDIDGIYIAPIDLEELVPELHGVVQRWRTLHPEREWADTIAQRTNPDEA